MTARRWSKWAALGLTAVMIFAGLSLAGLVAGVAAAPASAAAAPTAAATQSASLPAGVAGTSPSTMTPLSSIAAPPVPADDKSSSATTPQTGADREAAVISALTDKGISTRDVFLPNFASADQNVGSSSPVSIGAYSGAAPWGIGDFGLRNVSGVITPYETTATSVAATFSTGLFTGYTPDVSGPDEYGVQLNAVLNNVTLLGTPGYSFWTQNVFEYEASSQSLVFVSNIWNFSSPGFYFSCNAIYASSSNGVNACPELYYSESQPIPAAYPYSVALWLNSTLNDSRNEVYFNYSVTSGLGTYSGNYDWAVFNSTVAGGPATPTALYVANGHNYGPTGLPNDFEVMVGGPGGGSNYDLFTSADTYMTLTYLNSTTGQYQNVDSAYNIAGETGETSYGVSSIWSQFTGQSNGVTVNDGPSIVSGLWNVSGGAPTNAPYPTAPWFKFNSNPDQVFVFVGDGEDNENLSSFAWAPWNYLNEGFGPELPVGTYSLYVLEANYDPYYDGDFQITNSIHGQTLSISLTPDTTVGVYTPLWAFNESAVANISSGIGGDGNYQLFNNQYAPIGTTPGSSNPGYYNFPWFSVFNDYLFPAFPGIYLYTVDDVDILSPPSFYVEFPPTPDNTYLIGLLGTPDWNDLQIVVYDSEGVNLLSATVGGWWPAVSFFGPDQSMASVTYWNTSYSDIWWDTFETGGEALFLYGGYDNGIESSEFFTDVPSSPNPAATVAGAYGAIGMVDTDFGDAYEYGANAWDECDYCDLVFNNLFDTEITATQLYYDPYTGYFPLYPFSQAYNYEYISGDTNIVGGNYIGGNYWWDYGLYQNPYNVLPYAGFNPLPEYYFGEPAAYICESVYFYCDYGGGDFYPLTYGTVYTVTFEETGLPAGTYWYADVYVSGGEGILGEIESGYVYNYSYAGEAFWPSVPDGSFALGSPDVTGETYWAFSDDYSVAAPVGTFTVSGSNIVVVVHFVQAYTLTISESGLPHGLYWEIEAISGDVFWANETNTSSTLTLFAMLPGNYTWYVYGDEPYVALPGYGTIDLTGNTTLSTTFYATYSVTFTETGLPGGTTWVVTLNNTLFDFQYVWSGTDATVTITDVPALAFTWSASASAYVATPTNGKLTVSGNETVSVVFNSIDATGTFSGTVSPGSATLYVDGTEQALGSGGTFSVTLPVGVHSVEVVASGYVTYFNNVTVSAGGTTHLAIALTAVPSSSSSSSGIGSTGWLLIGLLAVVAAILLVTTLLFARRGRQPPPVAPYQPPAGAGGAPPSGATPAWQEPPPPPPSG